MTNSDEELQEFQCNITSMKNRDKIDAPARVTQCESLRRIQAKCQHEIVICSACGRNSESDQKIPVNYNSENLGVIFAVNISRQSGLLRLGNLIIHRLDFSGESNK